MTIVIAGGSGFLGRALTERLARDGHKVVVLSREGRGASTGGNPNVRAATWTPDGSPGSWAVELDSVDAVINLAGAGLADKRWSDARKQVLYDSRLQSTRSLAAAMRIVKKKPRVFVQASAVGFYGAWDNGDTFDESSSPGSDFLAGLAVAWEAEARPIETMGCRVVFLRSGVVLSKHGGALPPMARPFRFFVGGRVGSGRQQMSWIHLDDWVSLVIWAIETTAASGPINATAPGPVPNVEFTRAIGRALRRPSLMPAPGFMLRILLGEMADVILLKGQRVVPKKATGLGFRFQHPAVDEAIKAALA